MAIKSFTQRELKGPQCLYVVPILASLTNRIRPAPNINSCLCFNHSTLLLCLGLPLQTVMYKPNPVVAKVYFEMCKKIYTNVNWARLVKIPLCNLGFHDVWLAREVTDDKSCLIACKQCLKDQYIQGWSG